jgi:hypothetical protein
MTDAYGDQLKNSAISAVPGGAQYQAAKQQVEQAKATVNSIKSLFGGGGSSAPAQPAAAAAPVKKAPKPPSATLIGKALKKRSEKLGLEMKLDVDHNALSDGEGKAELRLGNPDPASDAKTLAEKVEKTAQAEVELIGRMKKAQKKLEVLEKMSNTLQANVSATFRTSRAKMSEVSKNLDDATTLIKLMQTRAADVDKKAQTMLSRLEDAASADLQKPGEEANKEAVAANDSSSTDSQATDEAKKEDADKAKAAAAAKAAEKARADATEKVREEARRLKKEAAEKEAEARKLKKELAEKEAEAKRAKQEADKKEKSVPRQTSSAKPAAPGKSAMADFEP